MNHENQKIDKGLYKGMLEEMVIFSDHSVLFQQQHCMSFHDIWMMNCSLQKLTCYFHYTNCTCTGRSTQYCIKVNKASCCFCKGLSVDCNPGNCMMQALTHKLTNQCHKKTSTKKSQQWQWNDKSRFLSMTLTLKWNWFVTLTFQLLNFDLVIQFCHV